MKAKFVSSQVMGTNCWLAIRFSGGECKRMDSCKYPEKKTCKASQIKTKTLTTKEQHFANGAIKLLD